VRSSVANVEQRFGWHTRIQGGRLDPRAQRHHSSHYLRHGGGVLAAKQSAALPAVCVPNFTLEPPSLRLSAATLSLDRGPSKSQRHGHAVYRVLRRAYLFQGHAGVCANPSLTIIATLHILPFIGPHHPCDEFLHQHAGTQ
jgi:hypothetical protein